ncbi:MAG: hypothetical protein ABI217_01495 [Chthoniobacterales bacterium]
MKRSLILSLGVVMLTGACAPVVVGPPPGPAPGVVIAVEDRPYYVRGPYYIEHGRRWAWVRGHWGHRHGKRFWIHGRYVLRG